MISLHDALAPADHRWERALFLCYQADLPYLERTLLLDLQRGGTGVVSLLVDQRDVEQSYSDANAIFHVGVNYSLDRVTLPAPSAAFHAKVYLLFGQQQIRLVLTSGNLTSGGISRNLEVIEVLTLDASGIGDRTAFKGCIEFLAAIPGLCPGLGARALEALRNAGDTIRERLAPTGNTTEGEPVFLHNAATPLLGQLITIVPPIEVSEITVVSPFYDRQSRAVVELAKAYPNASLRIVKHGRANNDMNGEVLLPFGDRLRVERFRGVDEHDRSLHAKAILLTGARRQWLATGSANMTAPAWLAAARTGGNLEAILLRTTAVGRGRPANGKWNGLFAQLRTAEVQLSDLSYTLPDVPAQPVNKLRIVRAHVVPGGIEVDCVVSEPNAQLGALLLRLADRERSADLHPEVRSRSGDELVIWASVSGEIQEDLALGDSAVLLTLSPTNLSDANWRARAWLEKPQYLSLSAAQRERRHALALLARQMFVHDVHLSRVADLIMQTAMAMATELRTLGGGDAAKPSRTAPKEQSKVAESPSNSAEDVRPTDLDWDALLGSDSWDDPDLDPEFMELDDELDETATTRGGAARTTVLGRLDSYLQDSLRIVDSLFSSKNAIEPRRGNRRILDSGEATDLQVAGQLGAPDPDGDAMLRGAAEDIRRAAGRIRRTQPTLEAVGRVADTFLVFVAHLYRLELHARLWKSPAADDIRQIREIVWRWGWCLDGWERGRCAAWMPRAWAMPSLRPQLRALISEPAYVSRLLALAAASWSLDGTGAGVPEGILAGIGLVSGESTEHDGPLAGQLRKTATDLSHVPLTAAELSSALRGIHSVSPLECPGASSAIRWQPLVKLLAGPTSTAAEVQVILASLGESLGDPSGRVIREVARRIPRGLFGTVHDLARMPSCSHCNQQLSTTLTQKLVQGDESGIICESCGAWLIPLAWDDALCKNILRDEQILVGSA